MKRIGMLTSGGDCQALNAAMRGVVKGLSENVDVFLRRSISENWREYQSIK